MKQDIEIEIKVIERFLAKEKQDRYKSFINKPRLRKKFINKLAHSIELNFNLFSEIKGDEQQAIKEKIKTLNNATDCYIISENENIDGTRNNVDGALDETIGSGWGTLLVFGDAELVYYEGEETNARWISNTIKSKKINY